MAEFSLRSHPYFQIIETNDLVVVNRRTMLLTLSNEFRPELSVYFYICHEDIDIGLFILKQTMQFTLGLRSTFIMRTQTLAGSFLTNTSSNLVLKIEK